jgi:hypothetical protein
MAAAELPECWVAQGEAALLDVEAEIGRLYELPPEGFVAARDELARRLRDRDRAAAERVRRLRRPTVAAWTVNQVARGRPELVAELIEAGDRLRQAQRRALSGLRDSGLRAAAAGRRELLDQLLAAAAGVLVEAGRPPEPHRDAIAATFEAASVDAEAAAAIRRGALERELPTPTGFGEVSGLELLRPPEPVPEPAKPPARRRRRLDPARRRELDAARRRRDGLHRKASESARAAAEARAAADRAEQEADDAGETAERLADEARRARRGAEEARRVAEEARREAEAARERAQRVVRRSRSAMQRASEAEAEAWSVREALEEAERRLAELEPDE